MRALLVAAGFLAGGLAAGAIWTWAQPDRYRADARVLVRPGSNRIVPAVEALAESSLVESNVAQTLHLSTPPHVSATSSKGGVLTVSVEAGSRERARQIDAEAVVILTQKVAQRFTTPAVTATPLDPAHAAEQTSPTPGRNLLITGLIGFAAGIAAAAGITMQRPRSSVITDPRVERRLRERIDEVSKRERALAKRAGELAARERQLELRAEELAAAAARPSPSDQAVVRREEELAQRQRELEGSLAERQTDLEQRAAELKAREEELAAVEPEPVAPVRRRTAGGWTLPALESLVRERSHTAPEQQEEWTSYLFFLREHADADGVLPSSFDQLVNDVFGPLPLRDGG
jgi:capsular polysaccharide biosynthesis protein